MNGKLRSIAAHVLPPLVTLAVLIGAWEAYIAWRDISVIVMPAPHRIAERFYERPWFFSRQGVYTLYEATLGLIAGSVVAVALAAVMAHSRTLERAIFPLAIAAKVMPLVAITPVLIIIFGFGDEPKIIVAALLCFFPMLVSSMIGFRDVDPGALEFFRSISASPWQVFWKLRVPSSLPYVLSALRVSYPLALIGAVVAEWFTGTRGLGYVIYSSWLNLRTPDLFVSIAVLAFTGIAINICLSLAERRLLFWHDSVRSTG